MIIIKSNGAHFADMVEVITEDGVSDLYSWHEYDPYKAMENWDKRNIAYKHIEWAFAHDAQEFDIEEGEVI